MNKYISEVRLEMISYPIDDKYQTKYQEQKNSILDGVFGLS